MSEPTPTALAAKAHGAGFDDLLVGRAADAFHECWAGARGAGLWDTKVSDAVARGALGAFMELFRSWAAECDAESDPAARIARQLPGSPPDGQELPGVGGVAST